VAARRPDFLCPAPVDVSLTLLEKGWTAYRIRLIGPLPAWIATVMERKQVAGAMSEGHHGPG
jgi:hypothetical protein